MQFPIKKILYIHVSSVKGYIMFSPVATLMFSVRNTNRASNGEAGRSLVAVGQAAGVASEGMKYNNIVSNLLRKGAKVCQEVAESDKVFKGITKAVNFAKNNVNPLIVCSSGLNVLLADDKQSAIISESGNLSAMFLCEAMMKKHLDKIFAKLPISKKWLPVVKGITFVIGSIGASTIGQKIGKILAEKLKTANEKAQLEQQQAAIQNNTQIFEPKSVAYKA